MISGLYNETCKFAIALPCTFSYVTYFAFCIFARASLHVGLGRGATGFTTRSDIGPARMAAPAVSCS